ncbi:MAG: 30S ribosomal protein S8 [Parcubacteria group bacterium]|nr:30S ribosomal protein S8 [Parcubacteria group bacterium]
MNDPISDMLARIKNAQAVQKETVTVPFSEIKWRIAEILKANHYIDDIEKKGKTVKRFIAITLKYIDGKPAIVSLRRVSKPGQRLYIQSKDLRPFKSGFGLRIISTSKGLMTNLEAKNLKLGGELICEVW